LREDGRSIRAVVGSGALEVLARLFRGLWSLSGEYGRKTIGEKEPLILSYREIANGTFKLKKKQ